MIGGTDPDLTHMGNPWPFRFRPNDIYSARIRFADLSPMLRTTRSQSEALSNTFEAARFRLFAWAALSGSELHVCGWGTHNEK
jgi:hypothetical protein